MTNCALSGRGQGHVTHSRISHILKYLRNGSNFVRLQAMANERGVVGVTWSILEFYAPLNLSGITEDRIVKFCARVCPRSISLYDDKLSPNWARLRSRDVLIFCQISVNLENNARQRYTYNGRLIGNRIWPIKWQQRQWPWITLKVIHQLQAFSNASDICVAFLHDFNWQCARTVPLH